MKTRNLFSLTLAALAALALAVVPDLHPLLALLSDPHAAGGLLLANAAVGVEMKSVLDAIEAIKKGATEKVGELGEKFGELQARLQAAEQRLDVRSRAGGDDIGTAAPGRLQEALERSPGMEALRMGQTPTARVALPAGALNIKTLTSAPGSGGALVDTSRLSGIVQAPFQRLTIRDLLPTLRMESGAVEYVRNTTITNSAAAVAEGELKPESDFGFDLQTAKALTIAHWTHATKQILDDFPQLVQFVATVMTRGLRLAEELQLLKGSGAGANMTGLYTLATPHVAPFTYASPTRIDLLRMIITQLENADYNAGAFVLNPSDWAQIELMKNADGDYLKSNPTEAGKRMVWGVPVIPSVAMSYGTFLLGDFQQAAVLFDRQDPTLDIATQDGDDFRRNMVKLRVEERVALAVRQPQALIKGSFPS